MTRGQKKFLYGLFYAVIAAAIVWAFLPGSPKAPAPCSGADCAVNPSPDLKVDSVPEIFMSRAAHRVVMLGKIKNYNPDYGANFSYDFIVFGRDGRTIATLPGNETIRPSETKYVLGIYDAGDTDLSSVDSRPGLSITSSSSAPAANFSKTDLMMSSGPLVSSSTDSIIVSGTVKNQSSFQAQNVKVLVILMGKYYPVFAAQTLIGQIGAFQEVPVSTQFPADQNIKEALDVANTQVIFYSQ